MAAYLIARVQVNDPTRYKDYTQLTPAIIERYGGTFVVRGGAITMLEGPAEARRMVVIEFPSVAQAQAFFESPEYQTAAAIRREASEAQFLIVEGTD